MTGLSEQVAQSPSLSAFSGTGFTTGKVEAIVTSPARQPPWHWRGSSAVWDAYIYAHLLDVKMGVAIMCYTNLNSWLLKFKNIRQQRGIISQPEAP